eukprot:14697518-Alexandrium_andersonii.AAC.1
MQKPEIQRREAAGRAREHREIALSQAPNSESNRHPRDPVLGPGGTARSAAASRAKLSSQGGADFLG